MMENESKPLRLMLPFESFQDQALSLKKEGLELYNWTNASVTDLSDIKEATKIWHQKVTELFTKSFNNSKNKFYSLYSSGSTKGLTIETFNYDLKQFRSFLQNKQNFISASLSLLSISDGVVNPEIIETEQRVNFGLKEKCSFLVQKLYPIYKTGYYFPITDIFDGNGIQVERDDEYAAIVNLLLDKNFIEVRQLRGYPIRLSTVGAMEVEEQIQKKKIKGNEEETSKENFDKILKEIKEELEKANCGNEVLYNELQEIKEALPKIPKKNLYELVKGKMFDLALKEVISKDTAKFLYKKLTGENLDLPALAQSAVEAINKAVVW